MSGRLGFPMGETVAASLISDALIPHVTRDGIAIPGGLIETRPGFKHDDLIGCVAVLGAFDGFHLGHAKLVRDALKAADTLGKPLVAITFSPDPSEVLGHAEGRLMDLGQRVDALLGAGATAVAVLRFDVTLMNLSPSAFVDYLFSILAPIEIHVGKNFRFGFGGKGTADTLVGLCGREAVDVKVSGLYEVDGVPVSATRIRNLIAEGKPEEAASLMGRFLSLEGTVRHGRGEGADLGFATANLFVEKDRVLLAPGVYAGYTVIDGIAWPTAANAGAPVSFGGGEDNLIEAHLVGFSRAIYGEKAAFVPLCMLRAEQRFTTREELVATVMGNIDWVSSNLAAGGLEVRA